MKIAYCILAHGSPEHLKKLITSLRSEENPEAHFFVHIDAKSNLGAEKIDLPETTFVKNRVAVYWAGYSLIQATLNVFEAAKEKGPFDYYVLLSGVDYPTRSNTYIDTFFEKNFPANFMNVVKMPGNGKTMDRVEYFYLEGADRTPGPKAFMKKIINKLIRVLHIKRHIPKKYQNMQYFGGSSWITFTQEGVAFVFKFIQENPAFVKFFKHTKHPDEMFFQTILMNSPLATTQKNAIIYTSWQEGAPSPDIISEKHLSEMSQEKVDTSYGETTPLFARKFNEKDEAVIGAINSMREKL